MFDRELILVNHLLRQVQHSPAGLRREVEVEMSERAMSSKTIGTELKYTAVPEAGAIKFVDTIEIDQEGHRLYAGDNWSGGVDVFDISSPDARFLKTIRIRGTFYGVCVAKDLNRVFVGLSGSRVAAIDIDPNSATADTVIASITVTDLVLALFVVLPAMFSPMPDAHEQREMLFLWPIVLVVFTAPMVVLSSIGFVRLATRLYRGSTVPS